MLPRKFNSFLKDYFTLTSRERKGAMTLALLIMLQTGVVIWLNYFKSTHDAALLKHKVKISNFVKLTENNITEKKSQQKNKPGFFQAVLNQEKLVEFNPNTAVDSLWKHFGFSQKQTSIIRNYINKGGVFRKKEDLSKIYGITSEQYRQLEPFIKIPAKKIEQRSTTRTYNERKKEFQKVDINSADTIELCRLPLIGPGKARMIYRYREMLGGFVAPSQLLEVYNMDSVTFLTILPLIICDPAMIRKINLNSDELRHPYLTRQITAAIKAYRLHHGNFSSLDDLRRMEVVNNELFAKLAPYVAFE